MPEKSAFIHYTLSWFMCTVILQVVGSLHAHYASQISLTSVAGSSGLSSGKEALVASSSGIWGCKSNGVVWCVDGPHMGPLLTLLRHFNWVCKVLNGQKHAKSYSLKSNAELWRFHSGHSDRRSVDGWEKVCAMCQHHGRVGSLDYWGSNHILSNYSRLEMLSAT